MTKRQIKERLAVCHEREWLLNKELGICDKIIKGENKKKLKIARKISRNMLYCNTLINRYYSENE